MTFLRVKHSHELKSVGREKKKINVQCATSDRLDAYDITIKISLIGRRKEASPNELTTGTFPRGRQQICSYRPSASRFFPADMPKKLLHFWIQRSLRVVQSNITLRWVWKSTLILAILGFKNCDSDRTSIDVLSCSTKFWLGLAPCILIKGWKDVHMVEGSQVVTC